MKMIHFRNVYNSIYIPTVNCIPAIPETLDSNANSGNFNVLAHKYVPSEELKQHQALVGELLMRTVDGER
jgi:hypothetical protein